jgi:hypothetical protein
VLLFSDIIAPKASFYNPITYTKNKFLKLPNLHQKQVSLFSYFTLSEKEPRTQDFPH